MSPVSRHIASFEGSSVSKIPIDEPWVDAKTVTTDPYGIGYSAEEAIGVLLLNTDYVERR
jgi:hypothetical protein